MVTLVLSLASSGAYAFCVPGDVGVCYVNGVQGTRTCGSNGMFGPCQVPQPPPPPRYTVQPKYKVLTVVYAPPGTAGGGSTSSVSYASGSSSGSTVSTANSFKQAYSVTASTGAGFLGSGGEISASFSYGRNSTNTQAIDIRKSGTTTITHRGPAVNGIDHDRDQIWLWLNPRVDVVLDTSVTTWSVVGGVPMDIQYVYVGHLKDPSLMPAGVASRLAAYDITPADYPEILKANPFAYGATAIDTNRYKALQTTFPYEPPYAPGDPIPTLSFNASYSNTSTSTTQTSNEYSAGFKVTAGVDIATFKAKLVNDNRWTWTDTDTRGTSTGTNETAQVTIGGPSYGYTGSTDIAVYYDVIYKTFMFAHVNGPLFASVQGTLTSASNESVAGREVVLTAADGTQYRTFTNARGEYRFHDKVSGAFRVHSETTERAGTASFAGDNWVDLVVP
jgi:hypothetical protein